MATEEELIDSPGGIVGYLQSIIRSPGLRVKRTNNNGGLTMGVEITGQVGPFSLADNMQGNAFRQGRQGEMIASQLHGRLYEQSFRKNLCFSYCAAQAMSLVGTGMVGNIVYNPAASGVNLVFTAASAMIVVTSATTTGIVLAASVTESDQGGTTPTSVTAATRSGSLFLNQAAGKAKAYAAATLLVAPTAVMPILHNTAAINTVGEEPIPIVPLEGRLIVPPGGVACLAALGAAGAASSVFSYLEWEEVPA